jgi:hypothetical protein
MAMTDDELREVSNLLLSRSYTERSIQVDLSDFQRLYGFVVDAIGASPKISMVMSVGGEVIAQFSDLSAQRFLITCHEPLSKDSFGFAVHGIWYGPTHSLQITFGQFLWEELKDNYAKLALVFFPAAILLFFAGQTVYDLMATLLIQSTTVFLSIYLIFTVSQSQRLGGDKQLLKQGILHRYFQDDRNITKLGILTIGLTFFNTMMISVLDANLPRPAPEYVGILLRGIKAFSTSLVLTLLFDAFITVADYYLGRTLDVIERDAISDTLDEDLPVSRPFPDETRHRHWQGRSVRNRSSRS